MNAPTVIKWYHDHARCAAASAHYIWLAALETGILLPRLLRADRHMLIFERVPGRAGLPGDLPRLGSIIGQLDAAAYRRHLYAASLREPHRTSAGPPLADFLSPRRGKLLALAASAGLQTEQVATVLDMLADQPAALYKDANPRNFVLTADRVTIVDFDDLTLAPFGYDLAKLVVTTAMTHGKLATRTIQASVDAYNVQVQPNRCDSESFRIVAEIHHLLTSPYLGRHGYRHPWPTVRPWPEPAAFNRQRA
ncbi:phosphotransferase [Frankia sp. CNm7]|uniref:Phosphotransferase n=1 Tax=Frankia nepalensis TaxID=1836974 RepID=A0A937RFF5_9ACTN|nr:phosphotransferase [Frankia nepalensis]MBL7495670.1 phosphotransferase [Frankia nepalensis]MBL7510264.1 phosphotransferase [Frankia nepalensis]MBL7520480.1 phosphotransferase [Frankia nepalensis]MBL7631173.1 phosphotransferase [Frankia nepalensis]